MAFTRVLTKTKQHIQIALLQRCVLMCIAWSEAFPSPGFPTGICRKASPLMLPYFKAHLAQPGTRQEGMGHCFETAPREQIISVKCIVDALQQRVPVSASISGSLC